MEKLAAGIAELPQSTRCKCARQEKASGTVGTGTIRICVARIQGDHFAHQIRYVGIGAAGQRLVITFVKRDRQSTGKPGDAIEGPAPR